MLGGGVPQSKGAIRMRAAISWLLANNRDTPGAWLDCVKTKRSLTESSPGRLIGSPAIIGPAEHQIHLTELWDKAMNLTTDLRRLGDQGGGIFNTPSHPMDNC